MVVVSVGMIIGPIIFLGLINIVLTVFGALGFFIAVRNIYFYTQPEKMKKIG